MLPGINSKRNRKKWMLELGNQRIRNNVQKEYKIKEITGKQYFESLGVIHYSIDKNGKDGAIPLNLSKPITDNFWLNKFDIGTNFGTLEHIKKENLDNMKPGVIFTIV